MAFTLPTTFGPLQVFQQVGSNPTLDLTPQTNISVNHVRNNAFAASVVPANSTQFLSKDAPTPCTNGPTVIKHTHVIFPGGPFNP